MKHKNTKEAKAKAIRNYGGFCVLTDMQNPVGCHIWPAGAYAELKCYDENILPIVPDRHTTGDDTFDWIVFGEKERKPIEKIYYLFDPIKGVRYDFMAQFAAQMRDLAEIMKSLPGHENNAVLIQDIINDKWL